MISFTPIKRLSLRPQCHTNTTSSSISHNHHLSSSPSSSSSKPIFFSSVTLLWHWLRWHGLLWHGLVTVILSAQLALRVLYHVDNQDPLFSTPINFNIIKYHFTQQCPHVLCVD
eukprot:Selendium_serpulae@DN6509_c4_g7_i2.p1